MRGPGRLPAGVTCPRSIDLAFLLERDDHTMNVHVLGRVKIGTPVEDEHQSGGSGTGPVELEPGLVPHRAIVGEPKVFAVQMIAS